MRNFQDTFETRKRSFISAFSNCMTVPLSMIQFLNTAKLALVFCISNNLLKKSYAKFGKYINLQKKKIIKKKI